MTYRTEGRADQIDVAVVTLDHAGDLRPEYHIWVSNKLSWVSTDDKLPQFAEWRTKTDEPQV